MIITIDGPAGSGKSTISKMLSNALNIPCMDTGAMYRAVGLYAFQNYVDPHDDGAVDELLDEISIEVEVDSYTYQNIIYLNGEDVTDDIREEEIGMYASAVASNPSVRELLVQIQRDMADTGDWIAEGRDMGTTVFPDAYAKFFLTASSERRAERRCEQLFPNGYSDAQYGEVLDNMIARDIENESRECSPLFPADDAMIIDTDELTLDEVLDTIIDNV